jgi:hypothetical protein
MTLTQEEIHRRTIEGYEFLAKIARGEIVGGDIPQYSEEEFERDKKMWKRMAKEKGIEIVDVSELPDFYIQKEPK